MRFGGFYGRVHHGAVWSTVSIRKKVYCASTIPQTAGVDIREKVLGKPINPLIDRSLNADD